jgi:hypothetical protein
MQDVYWRTPNPALVLAAFIVWLCLSNVLMINLLIAMMTKSFETFEEDTHRIWLFPAATLVLSYERLLPSTQVSPDKARLQVFILHRHPNSLNFLPALMRDKFYYSHSKLKSREILRYE